MYLAANSSRQPERRQLRTSTKVAIFPIVFQVVQENVPNILGLDTYTALNLVQRILSIDKRKISGKKSPVAHRENYRRIQKCFLRSRMYHELHSLYLNRPPGNTFCIPPQRLQVTIRSQVENELHRMDELGVINRVHEPTEWVNSLVTVIKPNQGRFASAWIQKTLIPPSNKNTTP